MKHGCKNLLKEVTRVAKHSFRNYKITREKDDAFLYRQEIFREVRDDKLKNGQPSYYKGRRIR